MNEVCICVCIFGCLETRTFAHWFLFSLWGLGQRRRWSECVCMLCAYLCAYIYPRVQFYNIFCLNQYYAHCMRPYTFIQALPNTLNKTWKSIFGQTFIYTHKL